MIFIDFYCTIFGIYYFYIYHVTLSYDSKMAVNEKLRLGKPFNQMSNSPVHTKCHVKEAYCS